MGSKSSLTVQGLITTVTADIAPSRRRRPRVTKIYTPCERFQLSSFLKAQQNSFHGKILFYESINKVQCLIAANLRKIQITKSSMSLLTIYRIHNKGTVKPECTPKEVKQQGNQLLLELAHLQTSQPPNRIHHKRPQVQLQNHCRLLPNLGQCHKEIKVTNSSTTNVIIKENE